MLYLWTVTGSGNANYLFFQGLLLSFFFSIWFIDVTKTVKDMIDNDDNDGDGDDNDNDNDS